MRSDKVLLHWYGVINKKFFGGELPNDVCVRWGNDAEEREIKWEEKYYGWTTQNPKDGHDPKHHSYTIVLSRRQLTSSTRCYPHSAILGTLAHEMIHVATQLRDNHGPTFEQWRQIIGDRGIFKKHALVKGLTIF